MGFCIFNNIAVGAAHALAERGVERLAIVDFDVHHGNGTEDIFHANPQVLFCSSFQHPFYPFSKPDTQYANVIKTPLAAGAGGPEFRQAIEDRWIPALEQFAPQLVLVSAGFDGHANDDMAQLLLSDQDYAWVTGRIKEVADKYAHGRIVSTLEGGYSLPALGVSVAAHLKGLLGP